jgi:peptide alpha-N-acetyltransferase
MADNEDGDVTIDAAKTTENKKLKDADLQYVQYEPSKEEQYLPAIRQLISKDLSEPYSIYVYRYFLYQWGDLCYMVPFYVSSPSTLANHILRPSPRQTP